MDPTRIVRPRFPDGYLEAPKSLLEWKTVEKRLTEAVNYWVCSVTPDGRPHAVPKWGVWVKGCFYFDGSSETKHARNLAANPAISVHLESGEQAVILNGKCQALACPDQHLAEQAAAEYRRKYSSLGYAPQPEQWNLGGLFEVTPLSVIAWTQFTENPTKFIFSEE